MEDVLKQVSLPSLVDEALLYQEGKYAPYLDLAIACEQPDNDKVAVLAQAVGLDIWRVSSLHVDAMLWAQQIDA
jgi:EAL and modified HD-GYP domain-containing signal transduction protein